MQACLGLSVPVGFGLIALVEAYFFGIHSVDYCFPL